MTNQIILQLIKLYCYISDEYNNTLFGEVQRFSRNSRPEFSDEEVMASLLWGLSNGMRTVKAAYNFILNYFREYFPKIPSYQAYNNRINLLEPAFKLLTANLLDRAYTDLGIVPDISVVDSMPIVVAKGSRSETAVTAKGTCDKGYCSSKKMHYYGVKLHTLAFRRENRLPLPETFQITPASHHDLSSMRHVLEKLDSRDIFADKAYIDSGLSRRLSMKNTYMITPHKKRKGETDWENHFFKAGNDLLSSAVSAVRQPIESFFSWLDNHFQIECASKVRSVSGLLVFIFSRLFLALSLFIGLFSF